MISCLVYRIQHFNFSRFISLLSFTLPLFIHSLSYSNVILYDVALIIKFMFGIFYSSFDVLLLLLMLLMFFCKYTLCASLVRLLVASIIRSTYRRLTYSNELKYTHSLEYMQRCVHRYKRNEMRITMWNENTKGRRRKRKKRQRAMMKHTKSKQKKNPTKK